jgi:hypothetical protein
MIPIPYKIQMFICLGIWQKFIQDSIGLGTALLIMGIREIPGTGREGRTRGGRYEGTSV